MKAVRLLLAIIAFCTAVPAAADNLQPGYLELTETAPEKWQVVWKAPVRGGLATEAKPALPANCTFEAERRTLAGDALVSTTIVRCIGGLAGKTVGIAGLDTLFTDALARVAPLDRPVQTARLTPERTSFEVLERPRRMQVAETYFLLGIEHIVFGFDHLLFVVALVILLKGFWRIVAAATAFTIAHSITLVATSLGFVGAPRAPVESVIALSIVFLALEIAKSRDGELRLSERFPWIVAFAFGLLHGFGFAGALAEIGLPEGEIPMALLTFNLGVEAGQLLIVAAAFGAIALLRRFALPALRPVQMAAAYAIGGLASFWFIERTFV